MNRYGVDRSVLLACLMAAAACTDPSFALPDAEHTPSASRDAESTLGRGDAGAGEPAASDAAAGATRDAVSPDSAAIESEAGIAPGDANVTDSEAAVTEAGPIVPPSDAGTPAPDAGLPPDPIPAWAKPLLGRFVKRSLFFAYDPVGEKVTVTVDVSLVTIAGADTGRLEWTGKQCSFRIHWADARASYTLAKPESMPTMHMWLSLGQAPRFSSDTGALQMGFDSTRQSRCSPGAVSAPKYDDQTWLSTSRCSCTTLPEVLPVESSDCRVTDPDGDGRAGVALRGMGLAFDISALLNTTLKIMDGEVRVDGEHILQEQRTRNAVCLGTCWEMNEVLCPGGETVMRPLPANATCADAISKVEPIPLPSFPMADCRPK